MRIPGTLAAFFIVVAALFQATSMAATITVPTVYYSGQETTSFVDYGGGVHSGGYTHGYLSGDRGFSLYYIHRGGPIVVYGSYDGMWVDIPGPDYHFPPDYVFADLLNGDVLYIPLETRYTETIAVTSYPLPGVSITTVTTRFYLTPEPATGITCAAAVLFLIGRRVLRNGNGAGSAS